ncbi:redoxin domain-containing protein [Deinococcus altitudinis]|uniref:redoxin domain-containing protein n=1 Tax=Deinococcus altitudinis TaxID=468914 RepID=UPI00389121B4
MNLTNLSSTKLNRDGPNGARPNGLGVRVLTALALCGTGLTGRTLALTAGDRAPDFVAGGQWLNSAPLHVSQLRGKVVIVNLWVYSCINCHLSLPTLQNWYGRYRSAGLEIVGVHTPEFASDRPLASVAAALRADRVDWPVMQDNDNATWNAYQSQGWPSFYLIDRRGVIRAVHVGEISSRFPEAIPGLEATIKKLLAEK